LFAVCVSSASAVGGAVAPEWLNIAALMYELTLWRRRGTVPTTTVTGRLNAFDQREYLSWTCRAQPDRHTPRIYSASRHHVAYAVA